MTGEPDNPQRGTDNAEPVSETDTLESYDFYDPDEDNIENQAEESTDDETQEAEPEAEVPAEEDAESETEEDGQTTEADILDKLVTLQDGTQAAVKDLIAGNMRQSDYTRKAQELSNGRKALEADTTRIQGITDAVVDGLTELVPAEPDIRLASTDPQRYMAQKAQYDAAMGLVQKFIDAGEKIKSATNERNEAEHQARIEEQNRLLTMALPETGTQDGRKQFFEGVADVAEKIGFSRQDVQSIDDHRIFLLAHWAKRGMDAEAAKAKAQEKVVNAPQSSVRKPGQTTRPNRNADAMRKLGKSGSLQDALAVDFE